MATVDVDGSCQFSADSPPMTNMTNLPDSFEDSSNDDEGWRPPGAQSAFIK